MVELTNTRFSKPSRRNPLMNWTEGALARHSRRKGWDKDAARQKEYFAKARARQRQRDALLSRDVLEPPFVPDYIPRTHPSPSAENNAPTRSVAHPKSSTSKKRPISQRDQDIAQVGSSTSPSSVSNFGRVDPNNLSPNRSSEGADLNAKRRRLLEKTDWTGVSFQKPILVNPSKKARNSSNAAAPIGSSIPSRKLPLQSRRSPRRGKQLDTAVRTHDNGVEMTMRIGHHGLRWSRESNSVRSPTTHNDALPAFAEWASIGQTSQLLPTSHLVEDIPSTASDCNHTPTRKSMHHCQTISSTPKSDCSSGSCVNRYRGRTPERPRKIVRSWPHILHQPQPTRGGQSPIFGLRSPAFNQSSSVLAQVGASDRSPSIMAEDNAGWNDWLNANDSSNTLGYINGHAGDAKTTGRRDRGTEELEPSSLASRLTPTMPSEDLESNLAQNKSDLPTLSVEREFDKLQSTRNTATTSGSVPGLNWERSKTITKPRNDLVLQSEPELPKPPNVQDLLDLLEKEEQGGDEVSDVPEETPEDEDELWKRFVLDDDSVETSRKAREEARLQTSHILCRTATHTSLPSDIAEPPSATREHSSQSPASIARVDTDSMGSPRCPEMPSSEAAPTEAITVHTNTSNTAQVGSPKRQQSEFKFHQPRPFIGRLASLPSGHADPFRVQTQPSGNKRTGRRSRKHRTEGRPDFRAMPNYDGDPIEECYEV
ncbi:hypothetical protein B0T10DRAFT_552688 [Thelonectria olida]|uniref:Uncharacterized protein n=1 Tax=Thelonectria olida TaxID=1576542 RepID=A0A9P8VTT0_9HYPO|nr:hypothetical protein B0T10DRAFT_552688 [Thelonectria olida]